MDMPIASHDIPITTAKCGIKSSPAFSASLPSSSLNSHHLSRVSSIYAFMKSAPFANLPIRKQNVHR